MSLSMDPTVVVTRNWRTTLPYLPPWPHVLKGTGTRDYNWLKGVWHDGSWLGESPADIQKMLTIPLILYWINNSFPVLREKLLNLQKAFENRQDRLLPAFKIGELAIWLPFKIGLVGYGWLSKPAKWLWPAFKSSRRSYEKYVIQ